MNKIYNNLNPKNLIKTECFNQFTKPQQKQIKLGIENNVDISWYAKTEFKQSQMNEIRLGLYNNVDVSVYAKVYFDNKQMEQIRMGL